MNAIMEAAKKFGSGEVTMTSRSDHGDSVRSL